MVINSAVFGEMDIDESSIYRMPNGLFGFDHCNRYALLTKQEDDVTLMWFQAVDARVPCFVVFDPFEIITGYQPVLEPSDMRALNCTDISRLKFLVIAVVPDDITKITVNLKSPLVLNEKEGIARQVILRNADYPIRFPLSEEPQERRDHLEAVQ